MEFPLSAPGLVREVFPSDPWTSYKIYWSLANFDLKYLFFSGTFIEIIIPAVVGGLLFLFFTCLLIVLLCKRKQAKKEETLEGQRNVIHIERLHRSNDNVMVSLEGTSQGIWRVNGKR